jgi:hypothetical protein
MLLRLLLLPAKPGMILLRFVGAAALDVDLSRKADVLVCAITTGVLDRDDEQEDIEDAPGDAILACG